MVRVYDRGLRWSLARRRTTMAVSAIVLVATVFLFLKIPKGFIPNEDRDFVLIVTEAPQGTSFQQMVRYQEADVFLYAHSFGGLLASGYLVKDSNQAQLKGWIEIDGMAVLFNSLGYSAIRFEIGRHISVDD